MVFLLDEQWLPLIECLYRGTIVIDVWENVFSLTLPTKAYVSTIPIYR